MSEVDWKRANDCAAHLLGNEWIDDTADVKDLARAFRAQAALILEMAEALDWALSEAESQILVATTAKLRSLLARAREIVP